MTWDLIGHEWAVEWLRRDLEQQRLRHAYLFTGPSGSGKRTLVAQFAQALLCSAGAPPCGQCRACQLAARGVHPDLLTVAPILSGKKVRTDKIKIEPVRQLIYDLSLKPVEARRRVARLLDFDAANPEAMNACLKTLEEPPGDAILLVTAESPDALLPTLVSRCEVLELRPLPTALVQDALITRWLVPRAQAELLARLSGGRLGWAVRLHAEPEALEERQQRLEDLRRLLGGSRVDRFAYADRLAREGPSDRIQGVLDLWASFLRDVLLRAALTDLPVVNIDRLTDIERVAQAVTPEQARLRIAALQRTRDQLAKNINTRLALEVLLLDWPQL